MSEPPSSAGAFAPRALPISQAFAWFQSAMRLFKLAPGRWCALGAITLGIKLALEFVPGIGRAAAEVVVPVVECGLLIGAAALDRGATLELRYAFAAFRAPPIALAAIVVSSLIVSAVEFLVAYSLAGVNLLAEPTDARLTVSAISEVIAASTLVSLPFAFVPFAALFQGAGFAQAFAASFRGFALNAAPLIVFGLISLALIAVGLLAYLAPLVAVFPLLAAANYAAWKDVYAPRPEALTRY
jgi:uncharacterized membrane protein